MQNYYVLGGGRVRRDGNTLVVEYEDGKKKPIPVENVDCLFLYGEVDLNTKLLNFLTQRKITAHIFNYYGFYAGSYYPREYLHSGYLLTHQVEHYSDKAKRLVLAKEFVQGSAHSLVKTMGYYEKRKEGKGTDEVVEVAPVIPEVTKPVSSREPAPEWVDIPKDEEAEGAVDNALQADVKLSEGEKEWDSLLPSVRFPAGSESLERLREIIVQLADDVDGRSEVNEVRGLEGKMRERYYHAWTQILSGDWEFNRRVRRPPDNEVNALISFGNSHLYTVCLGEIYRTQLTPTISYLHEPGARRFSLALDLSEIFKPIIVDRAIFALLNKGQLKPEHFDRSLNGCYLGEVGKKLFLQALEEKLGTTIQHRRLGRAVSYKHLIRLECYKLIKHLTGIENYRAFRMWW